MSYTLKIRFNDADPLTLVFTNFTHVCYAIREVLKKSSNVSFLIEYKKK